MSNFDLILLLIISEAAQNGLTGEDYSVLNSIIIITVLVFIDICFSLLKEKIPSLGKIIDGVPTILIYEGKIQKENVKHSRTDVEDILDAARATRGIENLEQIKYAILEKNGSISIIPFEKTQ
ncbi:MAG: YetF domain-containing protein [Phycisphaerales bacterium]